MWAYAILGTPFEFKKILKESWLLQMAACGRCYTFVPHIFLLMILIQNFILINSGIKSQA